MSIPTKGLAPKCNTNIPFSIIAVFVLILFSGIASGQQRRQRQDTHVRQQFQQQQQLQQIQLQQLQQFQRLQQKQQPIQLQKTQQPQSPQGQQQIQTVGDLLNNNSSCIEPPFRCPHPRIQFFLYTRTTQKDPELLDTKNGNSLFLTRFNPKHQTKIIIHGFQGGRNQSPSTDLRDAYFTRGDYNIIIVDYSSLAQTPCISQVDWAPRFCGKCIAQLVSYLSTHPRGVQPDTLHLLGYSVGSHIAGLAANYITKGKLGRITGLDPTILFNMGNNRSRDLDPTDAHFVDIIHTAAGVLGQWGPSGHADFYVNGGSSQPGCASSSLIETLSCDHTKVTPYFIESINSAVGFWAVPCPNRFFYALGWCNPATHEYVLMGEHVSHSARGIFYLETNAKKPYAKGYPGRRVNPTRSIVLGRK